MSLERAAANSSDDEKRRRPFLKTAATPPPTCALNAAPRVPDYFFTSPMSLARKHVGRHGADHVQLKLVSVPPVLVTVAVHPLPGLDGHSGSPS